MELIPGTIGKHSDNGSFLWSMVIEQCDGDLEVIRFYPESETFDTKEIESRHFTRVSVAPAYVLKAFRKYAKAKCDAWSKIGAVIICNHA